MRLFKETYFVDCSATIEDLEEKDKFRLRKKSFCCGSMLCVEEFNEYFETSIGIKELLKIEGKVTVNKIETERRSIKFCNKKINGYISNKSKKTKFEITIYSRPIEYFEYEESE